jgi:hypothetical protein
MLFYQHFFCLFLTFLLSLIILNLSFLNPFKDYSFSDIYYAEQIQDDNVSKEINKLIAEKFTIQY